MKRDLLLLIAALLLTASACFAQTGKYYINDRETTREQIERLPEALIESMDNTVEDGVPVVRVKLKPSGEGAIVLKASDNPGESREQRTANMLQSVYEQTTLLKEGDMAADFTAQRYAGGDLDLSSLRGKVVLLNFWGTWCGPCLKELAPDALPEVVLKQFAGDEDFVFLPVACNDTRESLDTFFNDDKRRNYLYLRESTLVDQDRSLFGLYARQGIPRSPVIDREGRIVLGSLGARPAEMERIAAAIEKALAE